MTNFIISEFNAQTQELTTREMTDEEQAQYLIDCERVAQFEAAEKERQAEADTAKLAVETKLAALGLDMDTIKAIAKLG
jgi:hypothetical protein